MKSTDVRNDAVAIALAVGSVVLAFVVVVLAKRGFHENIKDIGGPVMMLMLLPVGVYLVASGRITELGAFGVTAKLAKTAKEIVKPEMIPYDYPQIVGLRKLLAAKQEIDQSRPGVMKMTIGRKDPYTVEDLKDYNDALSKLRSFKLVVFLDNHKQVVAYMEAWLFKELVGQDADKFVQLINSDQKGLEDYPGVATKTISTNSTNIEALRAMQEQNLETLVIVDEQKGILRGVVERVQVLSSIMLSLAP